MKKISLKRWLIYLLKDLKAIIYKRYTYNYISWVGFQSRPFFYYIKKEEIILANNEKILNSRLQQKHDIEANWIKATNFRPKPGEIIIYDADENYSYPRVKIGNVAEDLVNDLPFLNEGNIDENEFYELLTELVNDPDSILSSTYAYADSVNELEELIVYNYVSWDDIDVDGGVASHEALEDLKHKNETNYWGYMSTNEFESVLQEEIDDETSDLNAKYATNNWVEDIVINEIGDKKSIYSIDLNNAIIEKGGYYNSELEWVEDANCCVYLLDTSLTPELKGKTINIITYMFGEMWTGCSDSPHTIKTNPNASTNQGVNCVFESTFTFSETADCPTWVYIPYYNNIYLEKPIVYELNTTLWQAVKNLNDKHESTEIDSWDYAISNGFYKSSGESPDGTEWFGISSNNKKDNIQIVWKTMDEGAGIYPLIKTRVKKEDTEWGQWHNIDINAIEYCNNNFVLFDDLPQLIEDNMSIIIEGIIADEEVSSDKTWSSQKLVNDELGNKDEIFNYTPDEFYPDTEGSYVDENGEYVEREGCNIYYLLFDGTEEFAGREIRVKTYMYGDMAIFDMGVDEHITNTNANITANPESGIFDYAFSFGPGYGTELYISFCENEFLSEPIFYEKKGTVWEEIRKTNGRQSQSVNIPYLMDSLSSYVMYEEIPHLVSEQIDINMEHITEQVIAALPVYNGEYSVEVV